MKYLYIFTLFLVSQTINSQTFNGDTGSFAGNATTYFNLNVSGLNPNTITDNFGLEKISLSLNCSQTHYISVILVGPNNVEVVLSHLVTWGSQYSNTVFKDQAPKYMDEDWSGSYNSTYRPDENIGVFNNGQNGNGIWKLKIVNSNSSAGNLSSWNITFSLSPSTAIPFFWSDIPIIKIQTNGQLILDDPKIAASMSIIDNVGSSNFYTDSPTFVSPIGIETRGQSSQMTVKKSYGLTTRDNTGADVDVSIFDMPAEEDWVLISNYYDETLIRNALAYELANQTGHYASRTQFCELFINEQYRGVYMFGEKLKRDNNRIDISKLEPDENSGVDLTGGYILKVDKPHYDQGFNSPHLPANNSNGQYIKFLYEYPEATDITVQQKAYIQDYVVNQFENALFGSDYTNPTTGWRAFADEISFMDYFFINEISKNVDAYRISTYLHKDKNGELVMGPVWDFDLAFHNADYCDAEEYTGWAFNFPCTDEYQPLPWFSRLFEDDAYCHDMHERWVDYRQNIFSDAVFLR